MISPLSFLTSIKEIVLFWLSIFLFICLIVSSAGYIWRTWQLNDCKTDNEDLKNKIDQQNLGLDLIHEKNKTIESIRKQLEIVVKEKRRTFTKKADDVRAVNFTGKECEDMTKIIDAARIGDD